MFHKIIKGYERETDRFNSVYVYVYVVHNMHGVCVIIVCIGNLNGRNSELEIFLYFAFFFTSVLLIGWKV